jgi:hypothetical protein
VGKDIEHWLEKFHGITNPNDKSQWDAYRQKNGDDKYIQLRASYDEMNRRLKQSSPLDIPDDNVRNRSITWQVGSPSFLAKANPYFEGLLHDKGTNAGSVNDDEIKRLLKYQNHRLHQVFKLMNPNTASSAMQRGYVTDKLYGVMEKIYEELHGQKPVDGQDGWDRKNLKIGNGVDRIAIEAYAKKHNPNNDPMPPEPSQNP